MQQLWAVALNDLRVTFRERGVWLNVALIPIILVVLIALANGGFFVGGESASRQRVDVIDSDNTALSARFLADLRALDANLVLCPQDNDEADFCGVGDDTLTLETMQQRVVDGVTLAIIEIPAGFEAGAQAGQPVSIIYRSNDNPTQPSAFAQTVNAAIQRIGGAVVAGQLGGAVASDAGALPADADAGAFQQGAVERAGTLLQAPPVTVTFQLSGETVPDASTTDPLRGGMRQSVPGMGTMYVMFTGLAGTVLLLTERKQWTLQRLITIPVRRWQVLGGKILARFIMCMIQYAIVFAVGVAFGANFGSSPLGLIIMMVTFALCTTALALLLATFMRSAEQAAFATTFVVLTLAPLGGAWWPLDIVPEWMRIAGHISPVAWAMDGFAAVIFRGGGVADVLLPAAVLLGASLVLFVWGITRFKYEG